MKMFSYLGHGVPIKEKLEAYSIPEPNSGCCLWLASISERGYGRIYDDGKNKRAHRVSYEEYIGPIPEGLLVLHRCDTPACINPGHLFLGTHQDNMDDMVKKERQAKISGENNNNSMLTEAQVLDIAEELHTTWTSAKDLGVKYQVTVGTIYNIDTGICWSHLTDATKQNPLRFKNWK